MCQLFTDLLGVVIAHIISSLAEVTNQWIVEMLNVVLHEKLHLLHITVEIVCRYGLKW